MKATIVVIVCIAALVLTALFVWRLLDHRSDRAEFERLLAFQPIDPPIFTKSLVADLPDAARRYFEFAIHEGTPLYTVARIEMEGTFGLGNHDEPNYMIMNAEQLLAAPEGFIWKMSAGTGLKAISGSDSAGWTRFWLAGLVPVARAGGTPDHTLSGFARYVSEAVFWTPAALLPRLGVDWKALDANTARVTIVHNGKTQSVDVTVDADGRPIQVVLQRWSNANSEGEYRLQPFGGYLSDFRDFEGFRLPTHVEGGNFIGTNEYFPFFIADVTDVRFKKPAVQQ
jgi:hypothetical protein